MSDEPEQILFYTYPRSGSYLTCHVMSQLLDKNVVQIDCTKNHTPIHKSRVLAGKLHREKWNRDIYKDRPILHTHLAFMSELLEKKGLLIVQIRNYRECMMRQFKDSSQRALHELKNHLKFNTVEDSLKAHYNRLPYLNALYLYESWDADKRLLLYYEDIMNDPKKEYRKLAQFLGLDNDEFEKRFHNYIQIQEDTYNFYNVTHGGAASRKTKDPLYHTKKMQLGEIMGFDTFFKEHFPRYWEKYLARYELKLAN